MPNQSTARTAGVTYAVSNTGPLISAFQSNSFELLGQIFAEVHISSVCRAELVNHGWEEAVKVASSQLVIVTLTSDEEKRAMNVAEQIAQHSETTESL